MPEAQQGGPRGWHRMSRRGKQEPDRMGPQRLLNWPLEPSKGGSNREVACSRLVLKRGTLAGVPSYVPSVETGRAVGKLLP